VCSLRVPRGRYNEINAISTACTNGLDECKELVTRLFSEWMNDSSNNP
jgi:aminopeptidase N